MDSYGVRLQVRQNGDLHVTETIAYRFGKDTARHGIVRTIPLRRQVDSRHDRVIQIRDVRVQGAAPGDLAVTTSGDRTVLRVGNPNVTVSGSRTYVIDYDVPRALIPRGTANELSWNAVGTEWTVPVGAVTVNVSAPVRIASATCRYGATGSTTACAGGPPDGSNVTFTRPGLAAGEGVTVKVDLPKAGMSVAPPPYEPRRAPFALSALGGVLALVAAGVAALLAWLFLPRRVPRLPAGDADEDGDRVSQHVVRGDRPSSGLAPYEAKTIAGLLGTRDSVGVSVTGHRWAAQDAVYDLLGAEARERGWFRRRRGAQRFGTACLVVTAIALFLTATVTASVAGVPTRGLGWAALMFLAVAGFAWFAGRRSVRTAAGARARAEVNAYAEALRTWREPSYAGLASRVFPYSVAFQNTRGWGEVFEEFAGDLSWYVPVEGSDERETANRIKRLAGMVAPRPREASGARRFGFIGSSSSSETAYVAAALGTSGGGWSSGDSGGGWSSGGDGGGGGGGW
ncbi:hypothetical protein GCM10029978_066600 [Actinoallomurus acanthiterrae]